MARNTLNTENGKIVYWTFCPPHPVAGGADGLWLVFLPGLSADHRLFEKQTEYLSKRGTAIYDIREVE